MIRRSTTTTTLRSSTSSFLRRTRSHHHSHYLLRAMSSTQITHEPSQVKGHMQWIKGVVSETIGSAVGSPRWKATGALNRAEGITEMRAAKAVGDIRVREKIESASSPAILSGAGRSQGMLGKVLGCEGMKERGSAKVEAATRKSTGGPYE